MPGEFAARKLSSDRQHFRWRSQKYVDYMRRKAGRAIDPLKGAPQGAGIVIEKVGREQKQPHSGIIKCVRVQLVKNSKQVSAFLPGAGAQKFVDEHDEIIIERIGGAKGKSKGDIPGVRWQVLKVNDQSLNALLKGKIEKARK